MSEQTAIEIKRYSLPEKAIRDRKKLLTLVAIFFPVFLSTFYFFIVFAISNIYLDYLQKYDMLITLVIGGIVIVCLIESIILITGFMGIHSLRKKELIIDRQGVSGYPFKSSSIHFEDVDEIIVEKNHQQKIISIILMNKHGFFLGIGGFNDLEAILRDLLTQTGSNVNITNKIRKYNPERPLANNIRLIGRSSALLISYYFLAMILVAGLIGLLLLLGMSFDNRVLTIVTFGSFILTFLMAPAMRRFIMRST